MGRGVPVDAPTYLQADVGLRDPKLEKAPGREANLADFAARRGDALARAGRACYRALVYEDADFIPYFRSATPIDVIERLEIGSRPASRRCPPSPARMPKP